MKYPPPNCIIRSNKFGTVYHVSGEGFITVLTEETDYQEIGLDPDDFTPDNSTVLLTL